MPNFGIQELSNEHEMTVGTSVMFMVDERQVEGEIIGIDNNIVTVVYISPSGEYSIDKFDKSQLKIKEDIDDNTKENSNDLALTNPQEEKLNLEKPDINKLDDISRRNKNIQKIKNALYKIQKNDLFPFILTTINTILSELYIDKTSFKSINSINDLSKDDFEIKKGDRILIEYGEAE